MKYCPQCHVKIASKQEQCPLCQTFLEGRYDGCDVFPQVEPRHKKYSHFLKWLLFICFVISTVCIIINLMFPTKTFWSGIVAAAILCFFIVLCISLTKTGNIPKKILTETFILSLMVYLWDYFTGNHNWSTTYVIPILMIVASVNMFLFIKLLHLSLEDYFVYSFCLIFMGLFPIIFFLTNKILVAFPSFLCILVSLLNLGFIIIFHFEEVIDEIKRRLHI